MRKPGNCCATGSSSAILPSSTSVMTAMAVKDLLTEATRIGVRSVTGSPAESCPYPPACTTFPP
jgi:hypothetical protein